MLVAQAEIERSALVTRDAAFDPCTVRVLAR
jgi:hypothetical protein